ncbi:acetamidase/formamidase family protein [Sporolactobacillus kofuensis]|uniref:Acetamidase/formamidase family protein n=1 Tax=Sporolactobacillus kofuensis TaxID=269672 RepID=A0ABW1WEZ9_9BACL|nr:acetamidase/formamidase family protein [Sporolactobacillus kofuensis]MCO7174873.1 acetamidase/formamidase family protein [Sporolactobacillus kofuensis]
MVTTIKKGTPIYAFSKDNSPVASVDPGEPVTIETYDCFEDQIISEDTDFGAIDWNRINPATGPIFINGATPGKTLAVHIDKIDVKSKGVLSTGKDLGTMGHRLDGLQFKIAPIEEEHVLFNDKIKIPFNKMIGVIGVAPKEGAVNCGTPGEHGGNMDTTLITEGTTLYFPIFHPGALFGLGDMHAAMGDGEIGVSGVEISGSATVHFEIRDDLSIHYPMISNNAGIAMIVSKDTLDEAAKVSVEEMIDFLSPRTDLSLGDLTMLMSAIGNAQISQIVDPKLTARFLVPRWFLNAYDIQSI